MPDNEGGRRRGAGRKPGSKNKATLARQAVAEVLDVEDANRLTQAVHQRGHQLLLEMERIALDPTQAVAARIMAARTALPFLLPRAPEPAEGSSEHHDRLIRALNAGRERVRQLREAT